MRASENVGGDTAQTVIYEEILTDGKLAKRLVEEGLDEEGISAQNILILPIFMTAKTSNVIQKSIRRELGDCLPASHEFISYNYQHFLDDVIVPLAKTESPDSADT